MSGKIIIPNISQSKKCHPQDFSYGQRVISYPRTYIQLRFSDKLQGCCSASVRHTLPDHCRSDNPVLTADTYCQHSHAPPRCSRWRSSFHLPFSKRKRSNRGNNKKTESREQTLLSVFFGKSRNAGVGIQAALLPM